VENKMRQDEPQKQDFNAEYDQLWSLMQNTIDDFVGDQADPQKVPSLLRYMRSWGFEGEDCDTAHRQYAAGALYVNRLDAGDQSDADFVARYANLDPAFIRLANTGPRASKKMPIFLVQLENTEVYVVFENGRMLLQRGSDVRASNPGTVHMITYNGKNLEPTIANLRPGAELEFTSPRPGFAATPCPGRSVVQKVRLYQFVEAQGGE